MAEGGRDAKTESRHDTGRQIYGQKLMDGNCKAMFSVHLSTASAFMSGYYEDCFVFLGEGGATPPWLQTLWDQRQDNRGMIIPEHDMKTVNIMNLSRG